MMNKKQWYRETDKANAHSNAFLEELELTYPADLVPLHLVILMTKCVNGLIQFGIKKEDVLARLEEDIDKYEKRYQDQLAGLN